MNRELDREGLPPGEGDPDAEATLPAGAPASSETPEPEREVLPDAPLRAVLEALLFASEEPATMEDLLAVLGEERAVEVAAGLEELIARYERPGSGLRVQRLGGGYRITTEPSLAPFLRELVRARNRQRLSRAALETLAVIAYKQPITAPEIQEIRGVNPSAILNALLERRLIRILGRKKVVGKPFLYGTTREFLIRFGLNTLEELPSMEEFETMIPPEGAGLPFDEADPVSLRTEPAPPASGADDGAEEIATPGPD